MKNIKWLMKSPFFLMLAMTFAVAPVYAQLEGKPQSLVDMSVSTLTNFTSNSGFQKYIKDARGVFIIPSLVKAGGGSGVLLSRVADTRKWTYPAFYHMDSGVSGLPADGNKAELVLLIMTDKAMSALLSGQYQPGPAAGADIQQFSRSNGVSVSLKLENTVIAVFNEWNKKYYGRGVLTEDVLIENKVQQAGADRLRKLLAGTLSR